MPKAATFSNTNMLGARRSNRRALRLYNIKKEAQNIRELHEAGEITAEEAAKRLQKLRSGDNYLGHGFKLSGRKYTASSATKESA